MFFQNRYYSNRMVQAAEAMLNETHGAGTQECETLQGMFWQFLKVETEAKKLNLEKFGASCRAQRLTHREAALTLIDNVVTNFLGRPSVSMQDKLCKFFVEGLEAAIDREMKTNPGRAMPQNGRFGRAASVHLSDFIKKG